ncbi:Similar to RF_0381: Putative ankyrin repeat protein RF_0381 (Rickettsia felis (strain ATCC VR-1525 / URRWXCal2)), partial [Cotesia congregata]
MANLSNMLASMKIPNICSLEINVTAVEELLNQPNTNFNMIVFDKSQALRYYTILLYMTVIYCTMRLIVYLRDREEINVTVVEEFLNKPDNNVNSIVYSEDRAFSCFSYTTLLGLAVEKSDEELIAYLIDRKANLEGSSFHGKENPLYIAAVNGDTKVFKKLYHLGANIHLKSDINWLPINSILRLSPLIIAARCGHLEIIKFLIEQGLDVNFTESECGSSLLHHAAASSNCKLVKFLLDNNAKINAKNHNGETPLLCAISSEKINIVKLLIARGADINNGQGSIERSTEIHSVYNKKSIREYLTSSGKWMTNKDFILNKTGQPILHYKLSSFDTCAKSCSIILDAGVDVNVQDSRGQFDCGCHMSYHDTLRAIIVQLILTLTLAGLTVCKENQQAVENGYENLRKTCLEEIQKMKINKVGVSNITFFDVLHMSFHYLAIRLKFAGLDQVIKEKLIAYPLYKGMLYYKLSEVRRRIKYLEEVEKLFEGMLWDLGLPATFIRELWSYFTNIDYTRQL